MKRTIKRGDWVETHSSRLLVDFRLQQKWPVLIKRTKSGKCE